MKLIVLVVSVLLGIAPGQVVATAEATPAARAPSGFTRHVLTEDGTRLRFSGDRERLAMKARGRERDYNRREVFNLAGAKPSRRQTTCATWTSETGTMLQEGLAARIRDHRGRVRAITLTKNTIFNVTWIFNVLTWDTGRHVQPWRRVAQFNMASALMDEHGVLLPMPWRACLRTAGRTVRFKIWQPRTMSEPSWSNPVYTRRATLPRGFGAAGRPGWYVGHVPNRGRLVYRNLTTS